MSVASILKTIAQSKWLSRKLALALVALTPAILRATGVEITADTWTQVAELVIGGAVAVAYMVSQGKIDHTDAQGANLQGIHTAKATEALAQGIASGNPKAVAASQDALTALLKS